MEGSPFRGSSIPSTPSLTKKNIDRATHLVNDLKSDNNLEGLKEVLKQLEESNVNFTQKKKAFRAEVTKQLKETIREIEKENLVVEKSPEEEEQQSESLILSSSDLSPNNSQKKLIFNPKSETENHSPRTSFTVMTDRSTEFVNQTTTRDEKTPEKTEISPDICANTNKLANIKLETSDNNSSASGNFQTSKTGLSAKKEMENKSSSSQDKSSPTEKEMAQVRKWILEAKSKASDGELKRAKRLFEKAYSVIPCDRTKKRIEKLQSLMSDDEESEESEEEEEEEHGENLRLCSGLSKKLYAHQYEGVQWMYGLFRDGHKGGILADDMGLGKTIQMITFIASMMECGKIKHVLLVVPFSLVTNWVDEFKKWAPQVSLLQFCGSTESAQKRALCDAKRFRSVLITTYGLCQKRPTQLSSSYNSRQFVWDYTILDEGHRIKNPTKTTKSLHQIPSKNRIILTGTPVQNKLKDLWALLDWSTQGSLLGTLKSFQSSYERPIESSRQKGATHSDISHGLLVAQSLKKLTDPFVLRRTKILLNMKTEEPAEGDRHHVAFPKLNKKYDIVCWTFLSSVQCKIYNDFLDMPEVRELLSSHRSPLVHLNILKKICDHPRLLSRRACIDLGLMNKSINDDGDMESSAANEIDNIPNEKLLAESGKLKFLIDLLMMLRSEGHRTAVFSSSRKVLNIIHKILNDRDFKVMRLDGRVTKMQERSHRVHKFQTDTSYNVFLLTIQVGGVGLTLTGANRAVLYDPSWNPSTDNQAVDRIYRIGQEKKVIIYRLITCGSVEEKMYRRQVFKSSIIKQTIDKDEDPYRYFTSMDLKELFKLDDPTQSTTQMQLDELHSHQREWDDATIKHIEKLNKLEMFGISDNDLMFSQKSKDFQRDSNVDEQIMTKVAIAQDTLRQESERFAGGDADDRWGGFKTKSKEPTKPQIVDKNEPLYEIEGLHDTTNKKETWLLTEREQNFVETEMVKKEEGESIQIDSEEEEEEEEEEEKKVETIEIDSEEDEKMIESIQEDSEEDEGVRMEQSIVEDSLQIFELSDRINTSKDQNESRYENESKISELSAVSKLSDKLEAELAQESHVEGNTTSSSRVVIAEDSMTSTTSEDASFSIKDTSNWDSFPRERKRVRNLLDDEDDEEPHSSSKVNLTNNSSSQADVSTREGDVTNESRKSFDRSNSSFYSAKSSAPPTRSRILQRKLSPQLSKELINETILDGADEDSQDLINSYLPLSSSEEEEELPSLMTRPSALNSFMSRRSIDGKLSSTPNARERTQHASYDFDDDIDLISSEDEDAQARSSSNNFSMNYENFKDDEADDEDEEELQKDISNILSMSIKYKEEDDIDDLDLT